MRRSRGRGRQDAEQEVLQLLHEHAAELLRFTRRFSLCADDAHDAYQRGMEILLRRMGDEPPENPLSWLRTVLRHEAGAVRDQRIRDVAREEPDFELQAARRDDDPADRAERFEELERTAEALRRLKPQEATALMLRAEGLSYQEICSRTGWTYTKCNRAITEGRRALISRLKAIESGAECERWVPLLSLLADGEASARELAELRPHLRSCRACRATLRTFYGAPRQLRELLPPAMLPMTVASVGGAGHGLGIARHVEGLIQTLSERAAAGAMRMQGAIDALPGTKVAAVAASTAALAGGGAAIDQVANRADDAPRTSRPSTVAASQGSQAPQLLAIGAPAGSPTATLRLPNAPGSTAPPTRTRSLQPPARPAGEFGFESSPGPAGDRSADPSRSGRSRTPTARAAALRTRSAPRRPAEFRPQPPPPPASPPSATSSAAASAPAPPSPAPAQAAPAPAPPEFAGP